MFLRLVVNIDAYDFLEEAASHFASDDENAQQSNDEIVLAALSNTSDEKLNGFSLRVVLSDHVSIPRDEEPDFLSEAELLFRRERPSAVKPKKVIPSKVKATAVKSTLKKAKSKKVA